MELKLKAVQERKYEKKNEKNQERKREKTIFKLIKFFLGILLFLFKKKKLNVV